MALFEKLYRVDTFQRLARTREVFRACCLYAASLRSNSKTLHALAGRIAGTAVLANHIAASLDAVSGRSRDWVSSIDNP